MARSNNIDNDTAQDVVLGNFDDLIAADLNNSDAGDDDDFADTGDSDSGRSGDDFASNQSAQRSSRDGDDADRQSRSPRREDFSRVSHTRNGQQRRQPGDAGWQPIPPRAEVRFDDNNNLVDANGQIVARAGKEVKLYQRGAKDGTSRIQTQLTAATAQHQQVRSQLTQAQQDLEATQAELETYVQRDETIKGLGLDPATQVKAMQLWKGISTDLEGTLKSLLTQAAARGINIQQLGIAGGLDPKSVNDFLKSELATMLEPLKQEQARVQQTKEQQDAAAEEQRQLDQSVTAFFARTPVAMQYGDLFAQLAAMPEYANASIEHMWDRIQLELTKRGIRVGDPLPRQQQQQQRRQGNPPLRRGMPNGRPHAQEGNSSLAPVDSSYESIVRDVLDRSGWPSRN